MVLKRRNIFKRLLRSPMLFVRHYQRMRDYCISRRGAFQMALELTIVFITG